MIVSILTGIPGSQAEAFAFVELVKNVYDPYTRESLKAVFRQVIWKKLLENSRDIVWVLRKLNLDHANRQTKVRWYLSFSVTVVLDICVFPLQANCEYIMNHRSDTDDPDFLFLPGFAEVVQELWTEDILPLLLDRLSSIRLADHAV